MKTKCKTIALVVMLLVSCPAPSTALADERFSISSLSKQGQQAYRVLLTAERFEEGAIGIDGHVSEHVVALYALFNEPRAGEAFKELLASATMPGQLYALCGLFYADHAFFLEAVEKYRGGQEVVKAQSGCTIFADKVARIVALDAENVLRLARPEQTWEEWRADRRYESERTGKKEKGFQLDVLNGGFPAYFMFLGRRSPPLKKPSSAGTMGGQ